MKIKRDFQTAAGISIVEYRILLDILEGTTNKVLSKTLGQVDIFKKYLQGLSSNEKLKSVDDLILLIENEVFKEINTKECQLLLFDINRYSSVINKELYKNKIAMKRAFLSNINNFISDETLSIDNDENAFLKNMIQGDNFRKVAQILSSGAEFLDSLYKNEEIHKRDKLQKTLTLLRLLYAVMLYGYIDCLRIKNNRKESLWEITYKIGLLKGELRLITSHLDKIISTVHKKSGLSKARAKGWENLHELEEKAERQASKRYLKGERILHNVMAENIYKSFLKEKKYRIIISKYEKSFGPSAVLKAIRKIVYQTAPDKYKKGYNKGKLKAQY